MNQNEKNHLLFINAMVHKAVHLIDEISHGSYGTTDAGKDFLRQFRHGRTLLEKALKTRIEPLGFETKKWLQRNSEIMDLHFAYKRDAPRIMKKFLEEDRVMRVQIIEEVGPDPVFMLSEFAMAAHCSGCDGSPRHADGGCPMYDNLKTLHIPEFDESNPKCGYVNDLAASTQSALENRLNAEEAAHQEMCERLQKRIAYLERKCSEAQSTEERLTKAAADLEEERDVAIAEVGRLKLELQNQHTGREGDKAEIEHLAKEVTRLKRDRDYYKREASSQRTATERSQKIACMAAVIIEGIDLLREAIREQEPDEVKNTMVSNA